MSRGEAYGPWLAGAQLNGHNQRLRATTLDTLEWLHLFGEEWVSGERWAQRLRPDDDYDVWNHSNAARQFTRTAERWRLLGCPFEHRIVQTTRGKAQHVSRYDATAASAKACMCPLTLAEFRLTEWSRIWLASALSWLDRDRDLSDEAETAEQVRELFRRAAS